ncbi:MAG: DUF6056 family protein [Lachnospiraceae bacterium]|nr:DUF6056 family protein [Lachnospiraceae bacterium]
MDIIDKIKNHKPKRAKGKILNLAAVCSTVAFGLSILPLIIVSFYGFAGGDDLAFGAPARHVMKNAPSLINLLRAGKQQVIYNYQVWQGTWSSVFLFSYEPSVFGDHAYFLTGWIGLFCIITGTFCFLRVLLCNRMKMSRQAFHIIAAMTAFFEIHYIPSYSGIYLYTIMAHYTIPFWAGLISLAAAMKYASEDHQKSNFLIALLLMTYIGGAGYPPIAFTGLAVTLVMLEGLIKGKKKAGGLIIPLICLAAGFIISAKAPGNAARAGGTFDITYDGIITAVTNAFKDAKDAWDLEFEMIKPLYILPVVTVLTVFADKDNILSGEKKPFGIGAGAGQIFFWLKPVIAATVCFTVAAFVRIPLFYALLFPVQDGISSGVVVMHYFYWILMLSVWTAVTAKWLLQILSFIFRKRSKPDGAIMKRLRAVIYLAMLAAMVIICIQKREEYFGNSAFVRCNDAYKSGSLSAYRTEMDNRIALLKASDGKYIEIPTIKADSFPFVKNDVTGDPNSFTNKAYESFYGVETIIGVE